MALEGLGTGSRERVSSTWGSSAPSSQAVQQLQLLIWQGSGVKAAGLCTSGDRSLVRGTLARVQPLIKRPDYNTHYLGTAVL